MKLDCRRCGTPVPIPPEATLSPSATLVCPGCGARYARRRGGSSGATSAATIPPAPPGTGVRSTPKTATPADPQRTTPAGGGSRRTDSLADPDESPFRQGELVAGRYRVLRFIARGGMGEVYEAEDLELRQTVALKTVHSRDARQALAVERFKREIHLARRVTHPNVCRIYDVGYHTFPAGEPMIFLSMELLEGETLSQRLKRTGPLTTEEALPLVSQMIDALAAAHAAGVVHRDFKSENVFLVPGPDGLRVVVTDFGVARGVEYDEFAAGVTVADAAVGTPAYMAPEQIEGGAITPSIDQYALGVVMFEAVTGQLPFAGETPIATAVKRLTQPAPSPREMVPGLDPLWVEVIERCLARQPADRFPSLRQVRQALHGAVTVADLAPTAGLPLPADPAPRATDPVASERRRRQKLLLAALSVALVLALVQAVIRIRSSLESPLGEAGEVRRAVAVVPFRNVAGREEFEWLSVGLAEMVSSELRAGEGLRTVPGDAVARAGLDLALGTGDEIPVEKLARLKTRLGADFVVTGSFTVLGSAPAANVRLAVRAEDTWSHETLGEAVESGGEQELFDLVARVGTRLRQLMGGAERRGRSSGEDAGPRSPRAARLYSEGLVKLRAFEPRPRSSGWSRPRPPSRRIR
ncbi:MAG: serine/threonine-protein kinase [Thermoanaerobaculia bacterium]